MKKIFRSDEEEKLKKWLGICEVDHPLFESEYNRSISDALKSFMVKENGQDGLLFSIFTPLKGYGITTMLRERQWELAQFGKCFYFYCTSEMFVSYCIDFCKHQGLSSIEEVTIEKLFSMPEELKNLSNRLDGIIIDDIDFVLCKEHSMEVLINLIRNLKQQHKRMILATNSFTVDSFENTDIGNDVLKRLILEGEKWELKAAPSDIEKRAFLSYLQEIKSVEITDKEFLSFLKKNTFKMISRTIRVIEYLKKEEEKNELYAFFLDRYLLEVINTCWVDVILKKVQAQIQNTNIIKKIKLLRISAVSKNLETLFVYVEKDNIQQLKAESVDKYLEKTISTIFNIRFNIVFVSF